MRARAVLEGGRGGAAADGALTAVRLRLGLGGGMLAAAVAACAEIALSVACNMDVCKDGMKRRNREPVRGRGWRVV